MICSLVHCQSIYSCTVGIRTRMPQGFVYNVTNYRRRASQSTVYLSMLFDLI